MAAPIAPQAIPRRALVRQPRAALSPLASGRMLPAGMRTFENPTLLVVEARIESLLCRSTALNPGRSVSTKKPWILSVSPSLAQTTAMSATLPLVIHVFSPSITNSSPSRTARVSMPAGFEPKLGSVSPKQPIALPCCMEGSQRCFCSSVP